MAPNTLATNATGNTMHSGESRMELVDWINRLLKLGYTRIEQCGTGAAICQIFDSIYLDVPLAKVKFNAKHEYEYLSNFKVLQSTFTKHRISQDIPVDRLIKCRFQDNLEFLQWVKRYWDNHADDCSQYDAIARRRGSDAPILPANRSASRLSSASSTVSAAGVAPAAGPSTTATIASGNNSRVMSARGGGVTKNTPSNVSTIQASRRTQTSATATLPSGTVVPGARGGTSTAAIRASTAASSAAAAGKRSIVSTGKSNTNNVTELENQLIQQKATITALQNSNAQLVVDTEEMQHAIEQLEKERGFYFGKLREIEVYIQEAQESQITPEVAQTLKLISDILYQTTDGFELPDANTSQVDNSILASGEQDQQQEISESLNDRNAQNGIVEDEILQEEDSMAVDHGARVIEA